MNNIRYGVALLLAATFTLCILPSASAQEEKIYTMGVIPTFPPVATHTQWTPFVKLLSQESGIHFRLKVYEKMSEFERDIVSAGAPDFIFANALQFVVAHKAQGYVPLVRGGASTSVVLFVGKDSPAKTVDDLSGKKIAFVGGKNL